MQKILQTVSKVLISKFSINGLVLQNSNSNTYISVRELEFQVTTLSYS